MRSRRIDFRGRPLRRPDPRFRPPVQFAWLIDRVTARLAEYWPAADDRQFGEPLPRAWEAVVVGDVFRCFRTAEKALAVSVREIVTIDALSHGHNIGRPYRD